MVLVPFGEEALGRFGLLGFWPWQFWALASAFFELCDLCGCRSDLKGTAVAVPALI